MRQTQVLAELFTQRLTVACDPALHGAYIDAVMRRDFVISELIYIAHDQDVGMRALELFHRTSNAFDEFVRHYFPLGILSGVRDQICDRWCAGFSDRCI